MISLAGLRRHLRRARDDEDGSIAVETVLMVPLMAWAMLATLTFFDAYRAEAISYKAGLTVADMYSRETDYITPAYVSGSRNLLRFLATDDPNPDLRVTAFKYDAGQNKYLVVWSKERGPRKSLKTSELSGFSNRLPLMADGEVAIMVETWIEYTPPWSVGIGAFTMETYNIISPRFSTKICWNATPDQGQATEVC